MTLPDLVMIRHAYEPIQRGFITDTYWPRLKSQEDVLKYIEIRNKVSKQIILEKTLNHGYYQRTDGGMSETQKFYQELKKHL